MKSIQLFSKNKTKINSSIKHHSNCNSTSLYLSERMYRSCWKSGWFACFRQCRLRKFDWNLFSNSFAVQIRKVWRLLWDPQPIWGLFSCSHKVFSFLSLTSWDYPISVWNSALVEVGCWIPLNHLQNWGLLDWLACNSFRHEQKLFQRVVFHHYRKRIVLRNLPHRLTIHLKSDQSLDIQNPNFQWVNNVIFFSFYYWKEAALRGICFG